MVLRVNLQKRANPEENLYGGSIQQTLYRKKLRASGKEEKEEDQVPVNGVEYFFSNNLLRIY